MNSQVILRRAYALAIALVLSLFMGTKTVYSQSVTFTPNGVWLPSMTSNERITMPVTMGQLVFDTNTKSIWYHTGVGGDWKELITVKPSADNLGNHTATQNINVGDYFLSPDGLDRGLKVGREQLLLQLPKPRFQLGTNLATNSQINFANYTRNWAISTSQDRFEIVDSTFQTRPFIIEKNAFHNMLYIQEDKIGIGTSSPREKLDVAGKVKMNGFQLHNGTNTAGFILQSDAGGNGTWVNPAAAGFNYWTVGNGTMFPNQNVNVGIGTEAPSSKLDVNGKLKATEVEIASTLKTASLETSGTTKTTNFQLTNGAINGYILQSDANGNASWKSPSSLPINFSESDPKVGSLSRNIVPKWNGNKLTDGTIVDNGNVGIGVAAPTNKLEVAGTTKTTNLQLTNGATNGYILQSDASGNAVWKNPASLPISFSETDPKVGTLSNNVLPKWNGTKLSDGTIVDNGNVGIGVTAPTNKLEVAGTTKTTNFQLTNGATNGYILQSDASGNATWKNPTSLGISFTETDPKVGSQSLDYVPTWDGNKLVKGSIFDNRRGRIGILNDDPQAPFSVGESYVTNLDAITYFNTSENKPVVFASIDKATPANSKGIMIGERGNEIQGRSDGDLTTNGDLILNAYDGNVGIGTTTPSSKLDVEGKIKSTTLQLTNGAANGYLLQSDADGNAIWKNPTSLGISFTETDPKIGIQTSDYVPTWDGNKLVKGSIFDNRQGRIGILNDDPQAPFSVGESYITNLDAITYFNTSENKPVVFASIDKATPANNKGIMIGERGNEIQGRSGNNLTTNGDLILNSYSGNVGIGTLSPSTKLDINGKVKAKSVQLSDGAQNGFILQSDASGNASWVSPNFSETDPKIGNLTSNYLPKWNGSTLANTQVFDNGSNVGIGTNTPSVKLDINGKAKATQLQLTTGATNDYVLKSDASGNASWADPTHLTTILQDADGNTKIEVEKIANEDVIHFSTNGKERLAIKGAQMAVYSTGGSTFLGYAAGENDDLSDNLNTYVGYFSGNKTSTGIGNVGLGSLSLENNVSGIYNVSLGSQSLNKITTSSYNTAIGVFAGQNATGSGNVFIGYEAGKNETGNNKLYIDNSNSATPLIYGDFASNLLTVNGKMGIGTTSPTQAKLVVNGNASNTLSYAYFNGSNQTGAVTNYTANYSIYASDRVAATEFNAFSDARIKDIKGKTNNTTDLETLAKIEITDYQFKDKIGKGNGHHKKVIAQQVETVYPQAVSKTTDIIPDIYRLANVQNNFVELPHHQLTVGEKVKLIFGEKQEILEVEAVNEKGFKVKNNGTALLAATSVFVYGREVSDFRSVDYEALSTLNISATQALLKRIEQLESENTRYKNEFKSFRAELEQLKAAVSGGTNETKGK